MSIKEIAKKAGTSVSTVSRVLNDPGYRCRQEGLRERIWKAAVELNYSPNEAARNLRTGKAPDTEKLHSIHLLLTRTDADHTDPFFNELLHVIESEIHGSNCIIDQLWYRPVFSDDHKCARTNLNSLISEMLSETSGKPDGLIIIGKCNQRALEIFHDKYKAVVSVNRNPTDYLIDEVTVDGKKIAMTAIEYLIKLGHEDIGYVGACSNESRYRGYLKALDEHNLDQLPQFVIECQQTETGGYHAMEQFVKMDDRPSAIYCANDITAIGALKYLNHKRNHFYKPSVISSDDIEAALLSDPMLTTVRLPKDEMGHLAVCLILDRLGGGHSSVVRVELEGRLMVRSSCRKVDESDWSDYVI